MNTHPTCSIDGCTRPVFVKARGFCAPHYHSWHRLGDPLAAKRRGRTLAERFWERVCIGVENECWEWQGYRAHYGHGSIRVDGRSELAHRIAWTLTSGPIPDGLCVLHECDNPPCCNPRHLRLGTQQENIDDMHRRGRYRKRGKAEFSS